MVGLCPSRPVGPCGYHELARPNLLTRVLGMMFGRPCSIAKELVRVDLPEARPNNPSHASDTGNIMAVSMAAFRATM